MIGRIGTALGVLLAAGVLASGTAWLALSRAASAHSITVGPWVTNAATGRANAGMYLRAQVAISGLFALNPSEAIYFSASTDDGGQRLRAQCTYAVVGTPLDARWWSLTAYADDNFLIPNALNRFSFNMGNLAFGADGTFRVLAAPHEQPGNWLPTGTGAGGFNLLFRLYNPAPDVTANLAAVPLPTIERVGDCA